ncbi:alpha/beta hydrolase [Halothiobacillus sp. DCM-1]|uniref:alpha/beta hydrolase n=1 Tax=Halothiobacillus sp. DCM-1 TaxID=3112558 RepID=UPI0032487018
MKIHSALMFALIAALAAHVVEAQSDHGLREYVMQRSASVDGNVPQLRPSQTFSYGSDPLQVLDFYAVPHASRPTPLIIFVHGGGWKRGSKDVAASRYAPAHFTQLGYAYAAINYRLVPAATVEQQGEDVALALKALLARAGQLGIDRSRVVLMGHSAGAHLVALVGTDERYLKNVGLSFADIRGVIPIDGAAYDVPRQIAQGGRFMHDTYLQAFGTDPARQRALSPVMQAAAPNAPAFLLLHVQRPDGMAQAKELETALKRAGTAVERRDFPGTGLRGHAEINRQLGNPDYAATPVVDAWLRGVFGTK